jgi:hypothetical protein
VVQGRNGSSSIHGQVSGLGPGQHSTYKDYTPFSTDELLDCSKHIHAVGDAGALMLFSTTRRPADYAQARRLRAGPQTV